MQLRGLDSERRGGRLRDVKLCYNRVKRCWIQHWHWSNASISTSWQEFLHVMAFRKYHCQNWVSLTYSILASWLVVLHDQILLARNIFLHGGNNRKHNRRVDGWILKAQHVVNVKCWRLCQWKFCFCKLKFKSDELQDNHQSNGEEFHLHNSEKLKTLFMRDYLQNKVSSSSSSIAASHLKL